MIIYGCHVNPYTVEKRVEHREQRRSESNKRMRRERTDHDSTNINDYGMMMRMRMGCRGGEGQGSCEEERRGAKQAVTSPFSFPCLLYADH